MGGDKQVVVADGLADEVELISNIRIMPINRLFERENLQNGENSFQLRGKLRLTFFDGAEAQFTGNYQAGADRGFTNNRDTSGHNTGGFFDQM